MRMQKLQTFNNGKEVKDGKVQKDSGMVQGNDRMDHGIDRKECEKMSNKENNKRQRKLTKRATTRVTKRVTKRVTTI